MRRAVPFALLLLAACQADVAPTLKPVDAKISGGVGSDRLIGSQTVTVRSFAQVDGKRTEVPGVACTVRAAEFSANVVTPQGVVIPSFLQGERFAKRGQPGQMAVTCKGKAVAFAAFPAGGSVPVTTSSGTPGQPGYMQTTTGVLVGNKSAQPWVYPAVVAVDLP